MVEMVMFFHLDWSCRCMTETHRDAYITTCLDSRQECLMSYLDILRCNEVHDMNTYRHLSSNQHVWCLLLKQTHSISFPIATFLLSNLEVCWEFIEVNWLILIIGNAVAVNSQGWSQWPTAAGASPADPPCWRPARWSTWREARWGRQGRPSQGGVAAKGIPRGSECFRGKHQFLELVNWSRTISFPGMVENTCLFRNHHEEQWWSTQFDERAMDGLYL